VGRTLKVIVGGEGNVGKTSLVRRYARGKFSQARQVTLGIDITTQEFTIRDEPIKLAIWDIEGEGGNRPVFYRGAQAAMLVYDVTSPTTLERLIEWYRRCRQFSPDAGLLVVGNKADLGPAFPLLWGRVFALLVDAPHAIVSAKTGQNVSPAFEFLARSAVARAARQRV
jgi:small GTP-binding protein